MSLSSLIDAFDQGEIDQGITECYTPLANSRYFILFPFDEGCEGIGGVVGSIFIILHRLLILKGAKRS